MKQIFTYPLAFALLALCMLSCRKEEHERTSRQMETSQVVNATVVSGQTYVLNLGAGSKAAISRQASHYELSEIATASDGSANYKYVAAKDFTGSDEVTLQQTMTSTLPGGGCSSSHSDSHSTTTVNSIVVKLNVAN